jgi:hypothetical protein
MDDFGLRRQSGSGDGAFERTGNKLDTKDFRACESGVALRLPPQSKTTSVFGAVSQRADGPRIPHSALSIPHLNGSFPVFILGWTIGANLPLA